MSAEPPARPAVLVVSKGLGLGGAERLLVDQALRSDAFGYFVAFIRPDKVHFVDELAAGGVDAVCLGGTGRPWPLALAAELRRSRPDVVHVHSPLPAAVARVLVRLGVAGRGSVVVSTEHNRWSAYRLPTRLVNAATMWLDRRTWAVSEEARGSVRPARLRRRVQTLHHGIDRDRLVADAAAADPAGLPERTPGDFVFVHVANRRPEKAHEVLVDAFEIASVEDPNLRLWLVGQHLDEPVLAARLATSSARDKMAVLGYRSDAPALIAAGDALVLSSDHEGLPVAVMEALTLGRPIVATAVGGIPEAVTDDVEGLLVRPRNPTALADAMTRLASDQDLRRRLGDAARTRSAAFDGAVASAVIEDAYRDLLAGR